MMAPRQLIYRLTELPDPADPIAQLKAGGDVGTAARSDSEHFMCMFAEFEPDSVSVVIRYVFHPTANRADGQQRLSIYLLGQAHHPAVAATLSLLMDRGPYHRLFNLQSLESAPVRPRQFRAACDVVRRQSILEPTVTQEFSARALPAYHTSDALEPNQQSDGQTLDSMLDRLQEPVWIDICFQPADTSREVHESAKYLSCLQQVNQTWDADDDEPLHGSWGDNREWRSAIKPLRAKEPLVDEVLRKQRRSHERLTQPNVRFHCRAFAHSPAMARFLAALFAASAFEGGSYQLFDSQQGDPHFEAASKALKQLRVVSAPILPALLGERDISLLDGLVDLGNLATVKELSGLSRLPMATQGSPRCIRRNTDPPHEDPNDLIVLGYDAQFVNGSPSAPASGVPRGVLVNNLPKHISIFGMSGGGKTLTALNIVSQLSARGIPFIVFEPAVTVFRRLKCLKDHPVRHIRQLARELRIYRPGSRISPMQFNPLRISDGLSRDEHIDNRLACFQGAMPMQGSMLGLLGEALELLYDECTDPERAPTITDLQRALRSILDSKGYSADVDSDFKALFDVRVGVLARRSIGQVFRSGENSPSIDQLLTQRTILELASLPREQACLLTHFLLTALRERIKTTPWSGRGVRLVIFLDEGHNIVGRSTEASPSEQNADPKAFASEFFCHMLAEMRSLGVAIIILDQLPSAIAQEVVKNTATKITFRESDADEREIVGGAMLFGPVEMEEVARLRPGEAFFHTEGYFGPQRIRTPHIEAEWDLPEPPHESEILPFIQNDDWYREAAAVRKTAELDRLKDAMDRFDDKRARFVPQLARLLRQHSRFPVGASPSQWAGHCAELVRQAGTLRDQLGGAFREFQRDSYRPLLDAEQPGVLIDKHLQVRRNDLVNRFESAIEPAVRACMSVLGNLIRKCTADPTSKG